MTTKNPMDGDDNGGPSNLLDLLSEDDVSNLRLSPSLLDESDDDITIDDDVRETLANRPGLDISLKPPTSTPKTSSNISISAAKILANKNLASKVCPESKGTKHRRQGRGNVLNFDLAIKTMNPIFLGKWQLSHCFRYFVGTGKEITVKRDVEGRQFLTLHLMFEITI